MSRPRKLPIIHGDDAFDAIYYFENTEPRNEEEKNYFSLAVNALRRAIGDELNRIKRNEYNKRRKAEDPEFAERLREYNRKYREEYRANGRDKWVRENRSKTHGND